MYTQILTFQVLIREKDDDYEQRTGTSAFCVDNDCFYYSYIEKYEHGKNRYFVRKIEHKTTTEIECFELVRGIGKDNKSFIYVMCSGSTSQVLKFKNDLTPVAKTSDQCAQHFGELYGLLVTSEWVFVCANKNQKLCILDFSLTLCHVLNLSINPIGIAKFHDQYLVTTKADIKIIEIDFQKQKYQEKGCVHTKIFNTGIDLRGICASKQHIYVTENDRTNKGRLICLKFEQGCLECVYVKNKFSKYCSKGCSPKCSPIALVYNDETVYYTQGYFGHNYHIMKLEESNRTTELVLNVY